MSKVSTIAELKTQAAKLPRCPGVYLMRAESGEVIYVGKAKELRSRVKSYFLGGDGRAQIEFLLRRIASLETIVTDSEQQAFVLERDLITKYKPRYNIRLKDDKSYLSIRVDRNQEWPRLELVRKVENDGARYFGPYSFSYELRALLDVIKRVVPLRTCSDTVFYNRQRPCLEYQIKRCSGPCCLPVDRQQYQEWVKQAMAILDGKSATLMKELNELMEQASSELRFEDAAAIRDRLRALESAKVGQAYVSSGAEHRDCFNIYREESLAVVSVLRVRFGHIADNANFSFRDVLISDEEVLESVVTQFYEGGRDIPEELVLPCELANRTLIESALAQKSGASVALVVPQKGLKQRLLGLADLNARQYFASVFDAETRNMELAKQLAKQFKLKQIPRRIECVDISNLQGSDIVGALVSFYDGEPDKNAYRRYIISFQDKPNDFEAMHEVVSRRIKRGLEQGDLPDLLVIDGGPVQLEKALQARAELGANLEIISLAKERSANFRKARAEKKPERVYVEGAKESVALASDHPVTHLMQRIRDEAHRFVITFHRQKRSKRVVRSALDDVRGLGPERRQRLLRHYKALTALRGAQAEEVARVGRMPLPLAQKVLARLNE